MFGGGDEDMSRDLAIDQLIDVTESGVKWSKASFSTYRQYYLDDEVANGIKICFRLFHFLTHDHHTLNIYICKKKRMTSFSVMNIKGPKVLDLIKTIERTKNYMFPGRED